MVNSGSSVVNGKHQIRKTRYAPNPQRNFRGFFAKQSQFERAQMNVSAFGGNDYANKAALAGRENKAKQTQFAERQNHGLSFLRSQESTVVHGSGFRSKCGMTGVGGD